MLHYVVYNYVQ